MLRNRTAAFATVVLVSLQGCSLIIDTNPDGVIREPKTAGAGGKSSENPTKGGADQGGSTSGGTTGSGGTAGMGSSVGGTNAGGVSNTSGGTNAGGVSNTSGGALNQGGATAGGNAFGGTNAGGVGGGNSGGSSGIGGAAIPASGAGGTNAATGGAPGTGGSTSGAAGAGGPGGASTGGAANAGGGNAGSGTGGTTCSSGTLCGTSCVDLATDKNHCGVCGHSCRYATSSCIAGKCQPVVLATGQIGLSGITQDTSYVYFGASSAWKRIAKDRSMSPSAPQVLTPVTGTNTRGPIIVQNTLLWSYEPPATGEGPTGFGKLSLNPLGTPTYTDVVDHGVINAIAGNGSTLYFFLNDEIVSAYPSAIASTTTVCGPATNCQPPESYTLAVDFTNAYWADAYGSLSKVPLSGGTRTTLATWSNAQWDNIGPVAVSGAFVYCKVLSALMRIPIDGSSLPVQIGTGLAGSYHNSRIAADTSGAYWAGTDKNIWVFPTSTGTPAVVAGGLQGPAEVMTDATTVYWLDRAAGTVTAVVK